MTPEQQAHFLHRQGWYEYDGRWFFNRIANLNASTGGLRLEYAFQAGLSRMVAGEHEFQIH